MAYGFIVKAGKVYFVTGYVQTDDEIAKTFIEPAPEWDRIITAFYASLGLDHVVRIDDPARAIERSKWLQANLQHPVGVGKLARRYYFNCLTDATMFKMVFG